MDIVCRYGGEEFAVICPGSTLTQAAAGAERVRVAIEAEVITLKEGNVRVTISIGAAEVSESEIAEGLIQRADNALYSAKHAGRNQVQLQDGKTCTPHMLTSSPVSDTSRSLR
jgi:diguanylate cyclase (GGDEF)-like protein